MEFNNEWRVGPVPLKKIRPVCVMCKKPRIPWIDRESEWAIKGKKKGKMIKWRYHGYGHFCTMTCATRFANKIVDSHIDP